jgi:hypothetical protein
MKIEDSSLIEMFNKQYLVTKEKDNSIYAIEIGDINQEEILLMTLIGYKIV